VLWFSDLKSYTMIADSVAPEQIIPLLNDCAEVVISQSLRPLIRSRPAALPCMPRSDCDAGMRKLNQRRTAAGDPATSAYLALHIGEVLMAAAAELSDLLARLRGLG
jgi:adenylate cyclase